MNRLKFIILSSILLLNSCSQSDDASGTTEANLIIKLKFDESQIRLDNLGKPSKIPDGNAAQTPKINAMSAHYIELAPLATTLLGKGEIIYKGAETNEGGSTAIDFSKSILAKNNDVFLTVPLDEVKTGNYEWVRISVSYQNGSIKFLSSGVEYTGNLASFLGYNNYISSFDLNGNKIDINSNKLQGFWAFEAAGFVFQGQAPEGAVTVPNPLFNSSPIPQGSCVLTGKFENGLTITGKETKDVVVELSFSINNSFEWTEVNKDGKYEPNAGENLVDMGLRGLMPIVHY